MVRIMNKLTCKICNREFKNFRSIVLHIRLKHKMLIRKYYDKFIKQENEDICAYYKCNNKTKFVGLSEGYRKHCSYKCSTLNPNTQKLLKRTNLKKYGKENPQQVKEVREKVERTNLKKYGKRHAFQVDKFKEKTKKTCLKRYGVTNISKTRREINRMKNGGAAHANSFITNPSKPQVALHELTKQLYPEAKLNYPFVRFSLDIAIPSLKISIEYDEPYWHQNKEYDKKRQDYIESQGWKVIRYVKYVPSIEELRRDVESCM